MKAIKKFLFIGLSIIIVLILFGFFSDGLLYFFAVGDDKIYGDTNKYIDSSLTGDDLTAESNLRDSYAFNESTNDWLLNILEGFKWVLKIMLVLILPLMVYFIFIDRDGAMVYLNKLLGKY